MTTDLKALKVFTSRGSDNLGRSVQVELGFILTRIVLSIAREYQGTHMDNIIDFLGPPLRKLARTGCKEIVWELVVDDRWPLLLVRAPIKTNQMSGNLVNLHSRPVCGDLE